MHEIDWEKVSYLDKERNKERRMIFIYQAFDEGNLMNLKNPRPINPVRMELIPHIRKSTKL